ncbi:MAG: RseA family anti-sigma factor [Myxococcota bacterium]|nr:RseA family anti-sigma factor [Myxococcota bacterium]
MSEREYEQLNRYLDGEMEPSERDAFTKTINSDEGLKVDHSEFSAIGELLREHVADEVQNVDFSSFFAGVESQIEKEGAEPVPASPETESAGGQVERPRPTASWWSKFWAPALLGAAAATVIVFFAMNRGDVPTAAAPQQVVVDAVSNDGNKTVLVSMPVNEDHATVIWLIDGEKEDQEPIDGEDPI